MGDKVAEAIKAIQQQEYYAELGRAAEKGLLEVRKIISCKGAYKSFKCDVVTADKVCSLKYFCQRWKGAINNDELHTRG